MSKSGKPSKAGPPLSYRDSGVDIERADQVKQRIKELARSTFNRGVVTEIGGFAGLFRPDLTSFARPLLVASADGVGTKLKIAFMAGKHDTVGIDLVAHCTNDILAQGAFPLFFLDYIASGRLEPETIEALVRGLTMGCRESACALLGGETAEMPDFYAPGEYDLAGFMVGIMEEGNRFHPGRVRSGDILIGLPSSGLHTNGYSLVRKILFEQLQLNVDSYLKECQKSVAEELLTPHRNYFPLVKELVRTDDLNGIAHITGGGIPGNLKRVLPDNLDAAVEQGSWETPSIFRFLRKSGNVENEEMVRTFNMGLGMILIAARERADRVQKYLQRRNENFYLIGEIVEGSGCVRLQ